MDWQGVQEMNSIAIGDNDVSVTPQSSTHGICVSTTQLTEDDYANVRRCFNRANRRVEGYLDCKELKVYMDLRRCPITQWEAEKLLEYADPAYHYYISLSQIYDLATLYGIGTKRPARLTKSEFESAIRTAFKSSSSTSVAVNINSADVVVVSNSGENNFNFDGVVNYFENIGAMRDRIESDSNSDSDIVSSIKSEDSVGLDDDFDDRQRQEQVSTSTREIKKYEMHTQTEQRGGSGDFGSKRRSGQVQRKEPMSNSTSTPKWEVIKYEMHTQTDPEPEEKSDNYEEDDNFKYVDDQSIPFNTLKDNWKLKLKEFKEQNSSSHHTIANKASTTDQGSNTHYEIQNLQTQLPEHQHIKKTIGTQISTINAKGPFKKSETPFQNELGKALLKRIPPPPPLTESLELPSRVSKSTKGAVKKTTKMIQVPSTNFSRSRRLKSPTSKVRNTQQTITTIPPPPPQLPPPIVPEIPGE